MRAVIICRTMAQRTLKRLRTLPETGLLRGVCNRGGQDGLVAAVMRSL